MTPRSRCRPKPLPGHGLALLPAAPQPREVLGEQAGPGPTAPPVNDSADPCSLCDSAPGGARLGTRALRERKACRDRAPTFSAESLLPVPSHLASLLPHSLPSGSNRAHFWEGRRQGLAQTHHGGDSPGRVKSHPRLSGNFSAQGTDISVCCIQSLQ